MQGARLCWFRSSDERRGSVLLVQVIWRRKSDERRGSSLLVQVIWRRKFEENQKHNKLIAKLHDQDNELNIPARQYLKGEGLGSSSQIVINDLSNSKGKKEVFSQTLVELGQLANQDSINYKTNKMHIFEKSKFDQKFMLKELCGAHLK